MPIKMRDTSSAIQMECVDGVWQAKPTVITYNDIIRSTTPIFKSSIVEPTGKLFKS